MEAPKTRKPAAAHLLDEASREPRTDAGGCRWPKGAAGMVADATAKPCA